MARKFGYQSIMKIYLVLSGGGPSSSGNVIDTTDGALKTDNTVISVNGGN